MNEEIRRAAEKLASNDPILASVLRRHHEAVVKAESALTRWVDRDEAGRKDAAEMILLGLRQCAEDPDGTRSGEVVRFLIDRYIDQWQTPESLPEGYVLAYCVGRIGREARIIRQLLFGEGLL